MMLEDMWKADVKDVVFSDLGKSVSYKRNDTEYEIVALILEDSLDSQEELSVDSRATIYVSVQEIEEKGLGIPSPHDIIEDSWEVETREKVGPLWKLNCYNVIRPRP